MLPQLLQQGSEAFCHLDLAFEQMRHDEDLAWQCRQAVRQAAVPCLCLTPPAGVTHCHKHTESEVPLVYHLSVSFTPVYFH